MVDKAKNANAVATTCIHVCRSTFTHTIYARAALSSFKERLTTGKSFQYTVFFIRGLNTSTIWRVEYVSVQHGCGQQWQWCKVVFDTFLSMANTQCLRTLCYRTRRLTLRHSTVQNMCTTIKTTHTLYIHVVMYMYLLIVLPLQIHRWVRLRTPVHLAWGSRWIPESSSAAGGRQWTEWSPRSADAAFSLLPSCRDDRETGNL